MHLYCLRFLTGFENRNKSMRMQFLSRTRSGKDFSRTNCTSNGFAAFKSCIHSFNHFQGPKGDKGSAARAGAVVVPDSNGLPTGFIEGPPGPPGPPGLTGKKVICIQ